MDRNQLYEFAGLVEELIRSYIAAHEGSFHSRVSGEMQPLFRERFLSLSCKLFDEPGSGIGLEGIGEFVKGRDVILFGGAETIEPPDLDNPFIVRVNNHYQWQQGQGKYNWTDGVYHGAGYDGMIVEFMNVPPKGLKFVAQNMGHVKASLKAWASRKNIYYADYGKGEGEEREKGVDPKKYEPVFGPLIEMCEQPFTGVLAAYHLLQFPIKSLHLTGFSFYKGREHVNTERDGKSYRGEHCLEDNKTAMRAILNDRRCKTDRLLHDSLQ